MIARRLLATPFPIRGPAATSWREQALGRAAEYRFLARLLLPRANDRDKQALLAVERHLDAAERTAAGWSRRRASEPPDQPDGEAQLGRLAGLVTLLGGASVERVNSQLDAVETDLLRLAPDPYLRGALPNLVAHVRDHLPKGDPRRERVEAIADSVARRPETPLSPLEREQVLHAVREASLESRREIRRVRSFRNVLLVTALILTLGVVGLTALGMSSPSRVPLCFAPDDAMVVCPTGAEQVEQPPNAREQSTQEDGSASAARQAEVDQLIRETAGKWDIPIVEAVGLLAAALAAGFTLRSIQGTSTPYSLPVALAILKLPSGALTAVLGLLLMRGGFIPGLSALDSPAQIIAWAIVFGSAQQLLTRFVDQQANTVLENVGRPPNAQAAAATAPQETSTRPAPSG